MSHNPVESPGEKRVLTRFLGEFGDVHNPKDNQPCDDAMFKSDMILSSLGVIKGIVKENATNLNSFRFQE